MGSRGDKSQYARQYLLLMKSMDAVSRSSFLSIYRLAPHHITNKNQLPSGHHVRLAMIEALRHPDIAYWVRLNLSIRIAKKLFETTGLTEKAAKLSHVLEGFHSAADAFVQNIPLEQAERHRNLPMLSAAKTKDESSLNYTGKTLDQKTLDAIELFKRQIIPNLAQNIRKKVKPL